MKASDLSLPTYEPEVSCAAYCYGGSVRMTPTTYPELTDANEVWVRGDVAAAEIERLRAEGDALSAAMAAANAEEGRLRAALQRIVQAGQTEPMTVAAADAMENIARAALDGETRDAEPGPRLSRRSPRTHVRYGDD